MTVMIDLDALFQNTPIGSIDKAIGNNLYGFNHRQVPGMVPMNKDHYGLTFIVRPQLNLSPGNIRNVRQFYQLLTTNEVSMQRFVRCSLDPRLMYESTNDITLLNCPFVDNQQAFFPIMTNNINSVSGWPSMTAPTFTSNKGLYNEAWSIVDGVVRNFESYDLTLSFRNTRGDPILYLFYIWIMYASHVFEGTLMPYMDYLLENEIDYTTRIYRITLDETKRIVRKISATGAAFPIGLDIASSSDYSNEKNYNDQNKDISVQFRALGYEIFDDILIKEFNESTKIFNPSMNYVEEVTRLAPDELTIAGDLVKVPLGTLGFFNHRGYPWINPDNYHLEWWIPLDVFNAKISKLYSSPLLDIYGR